MDETVEKSTMRNFIIFNPDEWPAEYAGCYGHPVVRTPNLDRLAAGGVRFDNAIVQHTVCSPSRCSFMTGWYPHVRGHRSLCHLLRPDEPNLFKTLRRAGYEVAMFGKNDLFAQETFEQSVDYHDDNPGFLNAGCENAFEFGQDGYYSFLYKPTPGAIDDHVDAQKVRTGIEFLRRPHDKPFCLFLPLVQPHCPYTAPHPYYDMYSPEHMPPLRPSDLEGKPSFHRRIRETRGLDRVDENVFRKLNAVYGGTITMIDEMLGWVLDALDETGLAENTTVLFFSDHGDWPGEYGLVEKWSTGLDDLLVRVPFIIRSPGNKAGHVVREPVELFDQMATILELADVRAEHRHFARSLAPQLQGAPGDPDRATFAEGGCGLWEPEAAEVDHTAPVLEHDPTGIYYPKYKLMCDEPITNCRTVMSRTATHKLIRRPESGEHELYDLTRDPRELVNLYGQPEFADIQRGLEARLLDWSIATADVTPFDKDPRGMPDKSAYWRRLTL